MNLTELILQFTAVGSEWVMWVLVGLSVASGTVMIERALFFLRRRVNVDRLSNELSSALRAGDLDHAKDLVRGSRAIECVVVAAGLSAVPRGLHAAAEMMLSAKARERLKLEAYLSILGTLGNNAPFVGLLGTVLGIIRASIDLTQAQAAKEAGATAVMSGVFEALAATAVGLFVALPAVVAFNFFQRRVRTRLLQSDALAHLVISFVKPKSETIVRQPKTAKAVP